MRGVGGYLEEGAGEGGDDGLLDVAEHRRAAALPAPGALSRSSLAAARRGWGETAGEVRRRTSPMTSLPGRNIIALGLGVPCVWMNMLRRGCRASAPAAGRSSERGCCAEQMARLRAERLRAERRGLGGAAERRAAGGAPATLFAAARARPCRTPPWRTAPIPAARAAAPELQQVS